jgi:nucleotide-binding universal stress UspA family protein
MPMDIKKILYATDLSYNSVNAFDYAISLAIKFDAEITILHVIDEIVGTSADMVRLYLNETQMEENLQKKMTYIHEEINDRLKVFIDQKVADYPELTNKIKSIEICKGYPAEEIIKKADDFHCDVIVMGTHGKGIVSQAFFGSVAKKVLRRIRKPVFIVPLPKE